MHRSRSTYQQPIHEARFSSWCFLKAGLVFICIPLRCIWSRGSSNCRSLCRGQHSRWNLTFQVTHSIFLRVNVLKDFETPDGLGAKTARFQDLEDLLAAIEFCFCMGR